MLLVTHLPDPTKSRGQYLSLLELAVKEDPRCPRNAFYYARELTFYKQWQDAITALHRYLDMPEANWANERCYAMRLLGKSYEYTGKPVDAVYWYRRATLEAPNTREPWVDLATNAYHRKDWDECYYSAHQALKIKDKQLVYTCDPEVWGYKVHDLLSLAAYYKGNKQEALEHAIVAHEMAPEISRLKDNVTLIQQSLTD
jgi:hypothetical protein